MKAIYSKLLILSCICLSSVLHAQVPVIYSVDKYMNPSGGKVTLVGSNFGNDATKLAVFFGSVKGTIATASNEVIEVSAPAGATFDHISVTNVTTGLTGYTNDQFLLSYGGEHPLLPANLQNQIDLTASSGLYDLCLCDFDGDNKTDIGSVNDNATSISLFRNASTAGSLSFTQTSININARSLHIKCRDFNGDGKPDLAISEGGNGNRIFILKNSSVPGSLSFSLQTLTLTGKRPKRTEIADLDLDGRPELIVTDQGNNASLMVFPNTSSTSTISFGTMKTIQVFDAASTDGIAIEDINDDHLPDIIVNQFLSATSNVFILQNSSTPGNIRLEKQTTINVPGTLVNLRVGDLDGDHKPDIAATQLLSSGISVFLNNTSNGNISFSPATSILTDERPWGIDFSDLDGDGKNDIVVASITKKTITILNNESTPGSVSFQKLVRNTTFINRHVRMGDLDGDGKPEIAFTSIDDNNLGVPASKVSIIRNKSCMTPQLMPAGPVTICSGFPLHMVATDASGVTYEWKNAGTSVSTGPSSFLDVTLAGQYTVTATAEGGSCIKTSNAVDVSVIASGTVAVPSITANSPVCLNDKLQLNVTSAGADGFEWTGPEGFTATGASVDRSAFKIEYAGRYQVNAKIGTCIAQQASILVKAVTMPDFKVNFSGASLVCAGDTRTLNVSPSDPTFTYQWFEKTKGLLSGATTSSYVAAESGEYFFKAQSVTFPTCQVVESNESAITFVTPPVPAFDAPAEACKDKQVQFTNQSTVDSKVPPVYLWDFGDSQTSGEASPSHTFSGVQNFNVKLNVSYGNGVCPKELTKQIKISLAPVATITTTGNIFKLCPDASLKLEVSGTFATYLWNTLETTPSITITKAGSYTVDVSTGAGCSAKATRQVDAVDAPVVTVLATPDLVSAGETSQITASGLVNYDWDHGKVLSDSTISNPVATPLETTAFKVKGKGANGCPGEATVEIKVKGDVIVNRLKPSNFFSPNGDAINGNWMVDNISGFPQCGVSIFDDKGIKVFESKPYLNNWDGTFKGTALPNGVYFYIIRCDGEESTPRSGSITLLR